MAIGAPNTEREASDGSVCLRVVRRRDWKVAGTQGRSERGERLSVRGQSSETRDPNVKVQLYADDSFVFVSSLRRLKVCADKFGDFLFSFISF